MLLAEVKSTSIYDEAKYGGNIDTLYKNNRNKFFKDFGVDQLVQNIKNLRNNLADIDLDLRYQKRVQVWPVIIFNERAFQTPLMAQVFQKRFKELMSGFKDPTVYPLPLTLIHISDLENMEFTLQTKPGRIWDLLSSNFRQGIDFLPPFYITLNRNGVKAKYDRVRERIVVLFEKFGPEQEDHIPQE